MINRMVFTKGNEKIIGRRSSAAAIAGSDASNIRQYMSMSSVNIEKIERDLHTYSHIAL
jgi:hypothetical protein